MDKKKVVQRNNPIKETFEYLSPFTVGNGSIAYTMDVTGMQTLYEEQENTGFPLLTMSDWGWHEVSNADGGRYKLDDDFVMTEYAHKTKGTVKYAVKEQPGNEAVYQWLRKNPHRYHLVQIGLLCQGKVITESMISQVRQQLDLYSGVVTSEFLLQKEKVTVVTVCHPQQDVLAWSIQSELCTTGDLQVQFRFPYGSHEISGADWSQKDKHESKLVKLQDKQYCLEHRMDRVHDFVNIKTNEDCQFSQKDKHTYLCTIASETIQINASISRKQVREDRDSFEECLRASKDSWRHFWEEGGLISFEGSTDVRAKELERRIVLSLYVSAINSCMSQPPQETGLTVNSWYGKAHLEMYWWHLAYLPLWGRSHLLKKSLGWYKQILPQAQKNAARNQYKGARWPKMVGPEGVDCPSKIATLLVWQQPHLIAMLEMVYQQEKEEAFLREYWELVEQSAEFMADYVVYNEEKNVYELTAPVIPAQERHKPEDTLNPIYEVEYWRLGLQLAIEWAKRLGIAYPPLWKKVAAHMAHPTIKEGVYLAHEQCEDTYTKFAEDHPSIVAVLGLLPGDRIDHQTMQNTLDKIYQVWNFQTMWGWDFAMMAMTEARLGNAERALEILLYDTEKNQYMKNGHNCQVLRKDLPLYLPGNGSLLLAIPLMAVGYPGSTTEHPGFPQDGSWKIETDGMTAYTF